jgi:hypothetical protein
MYSLNKKVRPKLVDLSVLKPFLKNKESKIVNNVSINLSDTLNKIYTDLLVFINKNTWLLLLLIIILYYLWQRYTWHQKSRESDLVQIPIVKYSNKPGKHKVHSRKDSSRKISKRRVSNHQAPFNMKKRSYDKSIIIEQDKPYNYIPQQYNEMKINNKDLSRSGSPMTESCASEEIIKGKRVQNHQLSRENSIKEDHVKQQTLKPDQPKQEFVTRKNFTEINNDYLVSDNQKDIIAYEAIDNYSILL